MTQLTLQFSNAFRSLSKEYNPFHGYLRNHDDTSLLISDIALAIFSALGALAANAFLGSLFFKLFQKWNITPEPQDALKVFEYFNGSNKVINYLWKAALGFFIMVGGPCIEEKSFRSDLWSLQKERQNNTDSLIQKVKRIFLNSLIFGACHLSPLQGWSNLPIFVVTSLLGSIFACLREFNGKVQTCAVAHMAHNSLVMILG